MKNQKVIVPLTEEEHAKLKAITASTRRTMGQELAYLAFSAAVKLKPNTEKQSLEGRAA